MEQTEAKVLEEQIDALAQKVATLTNQMAALLKLLGRATVMERIGVDQFDIRYIENHLNARFEADSHRYERSTRVRERERDSDLTQLLDEFRRRRKQPADVRP